MSGPRNVPVPWNFGRNLLQCDGFNDLTIKVKGGVILRANSAIVAFNSPVVMRQISSTGVPEICLDEVGEEATKRFLECCYSGDIAGQISNEVFSDMMRAARVLKVAWIEVACKQVFRDLCSDLRNDDTELGHNLISKAGFFLSVARDWSLMEILFKRLIHLPQLKKSLFIHFVVHQINDSATNNFELYSEFGGPEIFEALTEAILARRENTGEVTVTENERKLLTPVSLTRCKAQNREVYDRLLDVLEDSNDMSLVRFMLKVTRKAHETYEEPAKRMKIEHDTDGEVASSSRQNSSVTTHHQEEDDKAAVEKSLLNDELSEEDQGVDNKDIEAGSFVDDELMSEEDQEEEKQSEQDSEEEGQSDQDQEDGVKHRGNYLQEQGDARYQRDAEVDGDRFQEEEGQGDGTQEEDYDEEEEEEHTDDFQREVVREARDKYQRYEDQYEKDRYEERKIDGGWHYEEKDQDDGSQEDEEEEHRDDFHEEGERIADEYPGSAEQEDEELEDVNTAEDRGHGGEGGFFRNEMKVTMAVKVVKIESIDNDRGDEYEGGDDGQAVYESED